MNNHTGRQPIYQQLARAIQWRKMAKGEWAGRAGGLVDHIVDNHLPHGSGIDGEVTLDGATTENRIVIRFSFHHMNESGMYDGWTEHKAIITPSLTRGFDLRIAGRDRNAIKEYLADTFYTALAEDHPILSWIDE